MNLFTIVSNKIFLLTVLFFFSALSLTFFLFFEEKAINMIIAQNNEQFNNITLAKENNVAVIGSSHSYDALGYFINKESVLNLTGAYTVPTVMYFKLKKSLELMAKIKILYIEADYHLFYGGPLYVSSRSDGVKRWAAFFEPSSKDKLGDIYQGISIPNALTDFTFSSLKKNIAPILVKRTFEEYFREPKLSISIKPNYAKICDDDIWAKYLKKIKDDIIIDSKFWFDLTSEEKYKNAYGRQTEGFGMFDGAILDLTMIDYYKKMLSLAADNNIIVKIIRNPFPKEYIGSIPKNIIDDVDQFLYSVREVYDLDVLDYRYIFENQSEMFYNADHVNQKGSVIVSDLIRGDYCNTIH